MMHPEYAKEILAQIAVDLAECHGDNFDQARPFLGGYTWFDDACEALKDWDESIDPLDYVRRPFNSYVSYQEAK